MRRVAALLALLPALAACGGSSGPPPGPRLPRTLAQTWARQAHAIASAAAAGDGCRAQQLAGSLRDEVIADQGRVPTPLRAPLLGSVNDLADRIACAPPPATLPAAPPAAPPGKAKPAKPPKPPHGKGKGNGGDG